MFFLGFGLRSTGKVVLQRVRLNSGFCELVRSPRSRCESLDAVALAFSGVTDGAQRGRLASPSYSLQCRNLIAAAQNLLYCSMLTTAEMWVVLFDLVAGSAADQRRILVWLVRIIRMLSRSKAIISSVVRFRPMAACDSR